MKLFNNNKKRERKKKVKISNKAGGAVSNYPSDTKLPPP
jgi:hypothetical protein